MVTLESLKEEVEPFKDTLVINACNKIVKLLGVSEDDDDFYWIYNNGNELEYSSCALGWVELQKYLPEEVYNGILQTWNLNSVDYII